MPQPVGLGMRLEHTAYERFLNLRSAMIPPRKAAKIDFN